MANYLMRNKATFYKLLAAVQTHEALTCDQRDWFKRKLPTPCHPEMLVNVMWQYLTAKVAWNVVVCILRSQDTEFNITDLEEEQILAEFLSRRVCGRSSTRRSVKNALRNLSEDDLERVKICCHGRSPRSSQVYPTDVLST